MFRLKKIHKTVPILHVTLLSSNSIEIFTGPLSNLTLRDSIIIEKSIEFFNDANPCYLHRSAVTHRLLLEIEAAFITLSHHEDSIFLWIELPANLRYLIGEKNSIETVTLQWITKTKEMT